MESLSVLIITFNEEKNIARCLDSVKGVADEIILLDSGSTDNTIAIATAMGATVYHQPFLGYIEQKNKALDLASNPLVLSLDADEAIDERLADAIIKVKEKRSFEGYSMNRCTNYCGRVIRHGLWYPDRKLRLFNRNVVRWGGENPHDRAEFIQPLAVHHLPGDILHYSYNQLSEHVTQNNRFSSISAEAMFAKGKKTSAFKIVFNPWWSFVNGYFLRAGFLDGFYGLVVAVNTAHLTFLKHTKLFQLHREKRRAGTGRHH